MDIKRLAKAAKLPKYMHDTEGGRDALAEFARLVAAVEREACASICDHEHGTTGDAADKIRMRSNVELRGPEAALSPKAPSRTQG